MKQVTVTLIYVIPDSKLDTTKDLHHTSLNFLEYQGIRTGKHVESQQLYNVWIPEGSVYRKADVTPEGFLAFAGEKMNYTRGQALKKARVFGGKVVPNKD